MNEVSIIINGVRYDAELLANAPMADACKCCDLYNEQGTSECSKLNACPLFDGYIFKKSTKMSGEPITDATLLKCLQEFYQEKQRTEEYTSGIVWGDVNRSVSFHGEKILDVIRAANRENGKMYFLYPTKGYTIIKGNGCYLLAEDRENNLNKQESLWMRTLKYLKNFTRAICSKMR